MADQKRESSVLFSLRELRKIEEDRVKQEESDARQRVEDERARVQAEERRVRDEDERRRREADEAERARLDEEQRRIREDQLRLEETERKHRIDAQIRLDEQRLKMEIEAKARANSTRRAKMLIGASLFMAVVVAGLGVYAYKANEDRQETKRMTEAAIAARDRDIAKLLAQRDAEAAKIADMQAQTERDVEELKVSQDAETQKRIRDRIAARNAEAAAARERAQRIKEEADRRARAPVKPQNCKNPNDPLCGL